MAKMKGERTNTAADILMSVGLMSAILLPIVGLPLGPVGLAIGLGGVALGATFFVTGMALKTIALGRGGRQVAKEGILSRTDNNKNNVSRNVGKNRSFTIINHDDEVEHTNTASQTKKPGIFNRSLAQLFKRKDKAASHTEERELTEFVSKKPSAQTEPSSERTNTPSPIPPNRRSFR